MNKGLVRLLGNSNIFTGHLPVKIEGVMKDFRFNMPAFHTALYSSALLIEGVQSVRVEILVEMPTSKRLFQVPAGILGTHHEDIVVCVEDGKVSFWQSNNPQKKLIYRLELQTFELSEPTQITRFSLLVDGVHTIVEEESGSETIVVGNSPFGAGSSETHGMFTFLSK